MARRPSHQTLSVLGALIGSPDAWHYGYELTETCGIPSGTLYPMLMRLDDRGLLESRWEESSPSGRPPRHLYRLTASGRRYAAQHTAHRSAAPRPAGSEA